jgi:hypothetical protein
MLTRVGHTFISYNIHAHLRIKAQKITKTENTTVFCESLASLVSFAKICVFREFRGNLAFFSEFSENVAYFASFPENTHNFPETRKARKFGQAKLVKPGVFLRVSCFAGILKRVSSKTFQTHVFTSPSLT